MEEPINGVSIRRLPYPYRAMLAICSDLDGTPDGHVYFSMMQYLNTREETLFGPGVGLEVGNTIYFDVSSPQFCYWNTSESRQAMVRCLIQSGHIDCLHSFGSRVRTREGVGRALEELDRHDCRIKVWVDHARVPTNFGLDVTRGSGDILGSPAYHADLSTGYGLKYIWRGRVSSLMGQDVARSYQGLFRWDHPLDSSRTILKEFVKGLPGGSRYAMNRANTVLREAELRSGQPVLEFLRCNPHWHGVNAGATADGLPDVLSASTLDRLVRLGGISIIYTHLGRAVDPFQPFNHLTRHSLALLAQYMVEGKILVTTTRRLLDYCQMLRQIKVAASWVERSVVISVAREGVDVNLDGLAMYVPDAVAVKLLIDGREVRDFCKNLPDQSGMASVSLPWPKLEFPKLDRIVYEKADLLRGNDA